MKRLKLVLCQKLFILALIQLANCTTGEKANNANSDTTPEQTGLISKNYANNANAKENGQQSELDKYTGVWLFTSNGESIETGEKSTEFNAQKLVFIKKIDSNTLAFDSCDSFDIFGDPDDPGFTVLSDSINATRLNGVGNNVAFTFDFINDQTATGINHFTEGSYESYENIKAEKITTSSGFESKDDEVINVSELTAENTSLISVPSEFSINCFSVTTTTDYYIYNEKKLVNFIINGEDRIITSTVLAVQCVDSDGNKLLISTSTSDAPKIFSTLISLFYTDIQSIEHSASFLTLEDEKGSEDTDVTAEISGTVNIERTRASINIVADDKEGNSAAVDFSINF